MATIGSTQVPLIVWTVKSASVLQSLNAEPMLPGPTRSPWPGGLIPSGNAAGRLPGQSLLKPGHCNGRFTVAAKCA